MTNYKQEEGKLVPLTDAEEADRVSRVPTTMQELQIKREAMSVTPWQFRKAINQLGHRTKVEQLITTASQDIIDGWKVATSFKRLHPMVVQFGNAIPLTDIELDDLFELAAIL